MTPFLTKAAFVCALTLFLHMGIPLAYSGEMNGRSLGKAIQESRDLEPWEKQTVDFNVGYLFKVTNVTPLDYQVMTTSIGFKFPIIRQWHVGSGELILRTRIDIIADYIVEGAENYYFGFSGSPSFEWWNAERDFSLFFAVGGGAGFVDSTKAVVGGQGQDFTFNWFVHLGAKHQIGDNLIFHYGAYFHHLSNRGMDSINPGLNTVGPMVGFSYEF